jgi:hypothetical protein
VIHIGAPSRRRVRRPNDVATSTGSRRGLAVVPAPDEGVEAGDERLDVRREAALAIAQLSLAVDE